VKQQLPSVMVGVGAPASNIFTAIAYAFKKATAQKLVGNWNNGRRYIQYAQMYLNQSNLENAFNNMVAAYGAAMGASAIGFGTYSQLAGINPSLLKYAIQVWVTVYGSGRMPNLDTGAMTILKNSSQAAAPTAG
jgi:hypothetical protein